MLPVLVLLLRWICFVERLPDVEVRERDMDSVL